MPDRRSYGRTTPRSSSPPRRGRPTHDYVSRQGSRDRRKRGYSPSDASDHGRSYGHDGYCGDRRVALSSPPSRHRRCNPVDDSRAMTIGRSVGDRGRYGHGEQYSPQRRRRFEERGHVLGVAEGSRDGYRNGEHKKYDEFGRIIGVDDDAARARPVEGRPDGDYGGYGHGRPYAPPWQHARVQAENDVQGIAEDLRDGWRGGYRDGKIGSFDEFRRTDDIDGAGRAMPIGRWSDGEHGRYGPWEPYSPLSPQLTRVQVVNDMRGVTEDFRKDWRHGHQWTRRESDDESRKVLDVDGGSDRRDCYRGDNVTMTQKNESICTQYGELASGKVQWEYLLQKRGRNVDPRRRVGLNDCGSWSPGNSYKLSDGRGHKGEEVLNNDCVVQTSISMVTDESLRNFPGFLDSSSRETYKHSFIDYGHADPHGTSRRGKSLLEGMPSQRGLSTEGELPHAFSISQSKMMYSPPSAQVDVIREHTPVNSHGIDSSHQNVNHEAYALLPRLNSSRQNHIGSNEDLHGVSKYYMEQGSKRDDFGKMSDHLYDKVRERYGLQNPPSFCVGHTLFNGIDEMDRQENLAESKQLDRRGYEIGPSYVRVEDRPLGLRDDCPAYSKETFMRNDHLHSGIGEGYEGDYGPCLCQDGLENEILTKHDQAAREDERPFHAKHTAEEMDATSQYDETRLKRWHGGNVKLGRSELKEEFYDVQANNKKFPVAMYEDKHWTIENSHVCSKFHRSMVERAHEKGTDKRIPVHMRLDFRKHRDVRKRLGPPLRITKFSEATDLTDDDDDGAYGKIEPSEDLEEFKQLVNTHFLRFFKFLNETSAQHRKYSNHGGSGTFRCRVCDSTSKEFGDIKALVMHTFMCQAVGLRSEHLGFHKALCVLIGWDSSYLPDTPWVPRLLSEAAASNLREGLIIWPPVVVIHNSSLAKPTSEERILISIEHLEEILKGWGYGNWKKITRGKPANNSILLVIYKATLSGLLEAKKLGRFFSDKGRGKVELKNMVSGGGGLQAGAIGENAESVLYGYLGIAEDLENLDFETKKRCVIRSEKEIQNIVDSCTS